MLWLMEVGGWARKSVGHLAVGSFDGSATYGVTRLMTVPGEPGSMHVTFASHRQALARPLN
jgi:hypothetical protein